MTLTAVLTLGVVLIIVLGVSLLGRPRGSTTVDFYLAGQRVGVMTNSSAICGDYLSAASFLGVAAAVYVSGLDGAWYAVGFAAGFVPVLLLVAAPMRRYGEFSVADFLGRRFGSEKVRLWSVGVLQIIILCYLVPQSVGAGITWELLVGHGLVGLSPYATGVLVSTAVIAIVVAVGGMRGTTWNQAVQFILLMLALCWLVFMAHADGFRYGEAVQRLGEEPLVSPAEELSQGHSGHQAPGGTADDQSWFDEPGARYGGLGQLALVVTLAMGTAGLPHVMNRYFTAPTGRAARTTTAWVLLLVGLFYALAVMMGTAARDVIPEAAREIEWVAELTDNGVLRVPEHALPALGYIYGGDGGLGLIAAAALIAAMSTVAGLLLSSAATWGHDVYERHINPAASQLQAVWAGRIITLLAAALSATAAIVMRPETFASVSPSMVASMITWAFAISGSALTPVLILAIWWRGITAAGAISGMLTGGTVAVAMFMTARWWGDLWVGELFAAPTLVSGTLAVVVIVVVSRFTQPPPGVGAAWLLMHGTAADREAERMAALTVAEKKGGRRAR